MLTNFVEFVEKEEDPQALNDIIKRLYDSKLEESLKSVDAKLGTAIMYTWGALRSAEYKYNAHEDYKQFCIDVRSAMLTIIVIKLAKMKDSEVN